MWRQLALLSLAALVLFAAPELEAQWTLDPEPHFDEFRAEAAVQPDGDVLLTWTRQLTPRSPWLVAAATLDPDSGQIGEIHEWGEGGDEQAVSLGAGAEGYLAVRQDFVIPEMVVERLDGSGQVTGAPMSLGFVVSVAAHPVPDGGAILVGGGVGGTGGTVQAWRFGPDGALLAGPVTLADSSVRTAAGIDAAGNLVLVWTDLGIRGEIRVFARLFSPDLQALGPEIPVALGGASNIRVAVAPDGRFVVVYNQSGRLWSRPFLADGRSAGVKRPLSPRTEFVDAEDFDVAMAPDGKIFLVWKAYENFNVPTLRARFLSLTGRPEARMIRLLQIRHGGRGDLTRPRTEILPAGDFLVLWTRVDATGQKLTIQGRRFQ